MATEAPPEAAAERPAAPQRGQVSPDELDRLLTLIRPRVWVVLAGLLVLVGLTVVWAFAGTLTETVSTQGVIQRGTGPETVQAPVAGQVVAVAAPVGATVPAGTQLATIQSPDGAQHAVTTTIDGSVGVASVNVGSVVAVGQRLFTMQPTQGALLAVVVVPVDQRPEIYVGDEVRVQPTALVAGELGYVHGRVASIGQYPASQDELVRLFGDERLVTQVTSDGAVFTVQVELLTDPATKSGLDWSSRSGDAVDVPAGQLTQATIIVSEQSLVQKIFPG